MSDGTEQHYYELLTYIARLINLGYVFTCYYWYDAVEVILFNPLKPNSSNYYTLPYRPYLPFLISDIRALWRSVCMALNIPSVIPYDDTGL